MKQWLLLATSALTLAACQAPNSGETAEAPAGETSEEVTISENEAQVKETKKGADGETVISDVIVNVESGVTQAVDKVDEAVVSVINMQKVQQNQSLGIYGGLFGLPDTPYSDQSNQEEDELLQAGTGSGVVYKVDGNEAYVVTNNHVVEGSDAVELLFKSGEQVQAEVVGSDVWTDLAVLRISSDPVTIVAEFGDSDALTVGEPAIAIGSPLGLEFASSVTSGIISAKGRSVPVQIGGNQSWEIQAIQTDAAINPGNSGGALVNIAGQVIGINSMKISQQLVEGMGFAIPSNDVVEIVNQLEKNNEVIRPHLGITMIDLNLVTEEDRINTLKLPAEVNEGIIVNEVMSGTSAEVAGLKPYDVIVSYAGEEIKDHIDLRQAIYGTRIDEEVGIGFYRDGELLSTTVTMRPAEVRNY